MVSLKGKQRQKRSKGYECCGFISFEETHQVLQSCCLGSLGLILLSSHSSLQPKSHLTIFVVSSLRAPHSQGDFWMTLGPPPNSGVIGRALHVSRCCVKCVIHVTACSSHATPSQRDGRAHGGQGRPSAWPQSASRAELGSGLRSVTARWLFLTTMTMACEDLCDSAGAAPVTGLNPSVQMSLCCL